MTAVCQICGQIMTAPERIAAPLEDAEVIALQNFDRLAAGVLIHISEHHRQQAAEAIAVGHIAAKVYAMTCVQSSAANFRAMRTSWRKALIDQLVQTGIEDDAAAESEGGIISSEPSGSNEKNCDRKVST